MLKPVIILGASGHGKVIADLILNTGGQITGFLDDNIQDNILGFKILGKIHDIIKWKDGNNFILGIGNNSIRKMIDKKYKESWCTLIHPTAVIAHDVMLGDGTVILANSAVNVSAKIGRHCIINTGAVVEHDNLIGNYSHISPNAALGGNVTVGSNVHIGIGAAVINNVSITNNCIIGAGAVVLKDITVPGTYVGVPAKRIK